MDSIKRVESFDASELLISRIEEKAVAVNELRHKATTYDEVIKGLPQDREYPAVVQEVKGVLRDIIDESSCTKYEKYLYKLYVNRWDFYKKSAIKMGGKRGY